MEERLKFLFQKYVDNTCSKQEMEEFLNYVRLSEHDEPLKKLIKEVYASVKDQSSLLSYVDEEGNLILRHAARTSPLEKPEREPGRAIIKSIAGIAGSILLIIVPALLWNKAIISNGKNSLQPPHLSKKTTERSEYKYLLLPDSTQVWLNASSTLEYPEKFSQGKREVSLSGEAYFDVKHADKVPFIIHTGDISTTVLGTAFNIKAYPGHKNIIVAVSRGKVKVSRDNKLLATLIKGQQLKVNSISGKIAPKNISATDVAAWQQGKMAYDDEVFEDVVSDMERVYNVTIHVKDENISNLKITTSFGREIGVEEALGILCRLTDTNLTESKGTYIIQ
ncbi:MAG: FecR domain-containing protein [Bacteroidetes bacterium]|nr:FecR domain-containing protein [Bacteroidota bacterium]